MLLANKLGMLPEEGSLYGRGCPQAVGREPPEAQRSLHCQRPLRFPHEQLECLPTWKELCHQTHTSSQALLSGRCDCTRQYYVILRLLCYAILWLLYHVILWNVFNFAYFRFIIRHYTFFIQYLFYNTSWDKKNTLKSRLAMFICILTEYWQTKVFSKNHVVPNSNSENYSQIDLLVNSLNNSF